MKTAQLTCLREFPGQFPSDIYEVNFDFDGLTVRVYPEQDGPAVSFRNPIGFRFLDEGDLLEFWSEEDSEPDGWIFQVQSGGWLELESNRDGFLSSDRKGLKEYFLATVNGCLSVLTFSEPKIAK